jgi:hypothetical protein
LTHKKRKFRLNNPKQTINLKILCHGSDTCVKIVNFSGVLKRAGTFQTGQQHDRHATNFYTILFIYEMVILRIQT